MQVMFIQSQGSCANYFTVFNRHSMERTRRLNFMSYDRSTEPQADFLESPGWVYSRPRRSFCPKTTVFLVF